MRVGGIGFELNSKRRTLGGANPGAPPKAAGRGAYNPLGEMKITRRLQRATLNGGRP